MPHAGWRFDSLDGAWLLYGTASGDPGANEGRGPGHRPCTPSAPDPAVLRPLTSLVFLMWEVE